MIRSTDLRPARGMSLVELMLALTIGLVLIGGAIQLYMTGRNSMRTSESISSMQENARFALAMLEPDVALANYWGLHNWATTIERRARAPDPLTDAVAIGNPCSPRWAIDLDVAVEGYDGAHPGWGCLSVADFKAGTDILVVRHAGADIIDAGALEAGKIYVRTDQSPRGELFVGAEPGGFGTMAENHVLETHAYYVRPYTFVNADGSKDGVPCLRRLVLADGGDDPRVEDTEVMSGVEDLQVQFGVDSDGILGESDGSVNMYVDPDNPVLAEAGVRVQSVRLWLLVRADNIELGFEDDARYRYANVDYAIDERPDLPQGYRRLLVTKTIELRNL
jgi:type IV pilus assembly protein PilW